MNRLKLIGIAAGVSALAFTGAVFAADGKKEAVKPQATDHPLEELWSGYYFAKKETNAMQDDDFENPGMTWYDVGEAQWTKVDGKAGKSCASCHKDVSSMKGVATRFPIYHAASKKILNIEGRINLCRKDNMKAKPWKYDSAKMLGTVIYVKAQSRGMVINVKVDGPAKPFFEKGKAFYHQRRGQLDMACAHCHLKYYGKQIRMNVLSQGHSNGFPVYRLKWQKPGSLHRRFKGCNKQVRAKPFKTGSEEYMNLELYLAWRGNGLTVETPAVRN